MLNSTNTRRVQMAIVAVHGANRNADDYICSLTAAVLENRKDVLLLAPRFPVADDTDLEIKEGGMVMVWNN